MYHTICDAITSRCDDTVFVVTRRQKYKNININIKYAYKRNIIKRLIRETFRLLQHKLTSMDFVVIAQKNVIFLKNKNVINILENLWLKYRQ